jgi:hypothetical protein
MKESITIEEFGGTVFDSFEDLLAPATQAERAEDRADLADIEQAERDAARERPYFI